MAQQLDPRARILQGALRLAARRGWANLSIEDVAVEARLPLARVRRICPSKHSLLVALIDEIDRVALAPQPDGEQSQSTRDRLFELLMRRFDAIVPMKAGIAAIAHGVSADPFAAAALLPRFMRAMSSTLEAAGGGAAGPIGAAALGLAYLSTFRLWLSDDSPDMARTMAGLDRRLRALERLAEPCARASEGRGAAAG